MAAPAFQAHTLEPVRCFTCGATLVAARARARARAVDVKLCCRRMLMGVPLDPLPRDADLWAGAMTVRVEEAVPPERYKWFGEARRRVAGIVSRRP